MDATKLNILICGLTSDSSLLFIPLYNFLKSSKLKIEFFVPEYSGAVCLIEQKIPYIGLRSVNREINLDINDKNLLRVYSRSILNIRRASKLTLRTRPPVLSLTYLRLILGALRIAFQFITCYRHHLPSNIAKAEYQGPEIKKSDMLSYISAGTNTGSVK